ncbi:hypothetical protein, partial [Acidicapsa acidisoli]|uniref:hypothetical protein n=1 Tax=Acidicapsa acidisoli TaxID=1615681 RepID=UPI0021DFB539
MKFDMYNYATSTGTQSMTGYYYGPDQYPDNWAAGAYNPIPSTDMAPSGINLGSGDEFSATIVNNG